MAKKRPMRLEDLFAMRVVGRVALAPDGSRIVFELKRHDLDANANYTQLMVVDTDEGEARPLTAAGPHSDTLPQFSPDGGRLAFLSNRKGKTSGLYVLNLAGGEPQLLTTTLSSDVHDFAWSPDGRRIAYLAQDITPREVLERAGKSEEVQKLPTYKHITRLTHKLDGVGFWNGCYKHVHVIPSRGGRSRQLTTGKFDHREPRFSPDGRLVSLVANRGDDPDRNYDQSDIFVVPVGGGRLKKLTSGPGNCAGHSWSPDGAWIAFIGQTNKPGEWWKTDSHVHVIPAGGGKPRDLARQLDADHFNMTMGDVAGTSFEPAAPRWSPDSRRLYFVASRNGATRLYSRSLKKSDLRIEVDGEISIWNLDWAPGVETFALAIGTNTNPADVFVWRPGEAAPTRRTDVNGDLFKRVTVVKPEEFTLRNGRTELQCWVMKPPGFRADRKYPAILEIHGGPMTQYGYGFFHEMQWMAAKGYVVAYTNPRGSAGYGAEFRRCITGDWGNLDYKDVTKLGDWLFSRRYVDSKRVGVTGGSYGGYMTNWIVGHEQRYKAAVTQRSVVTWTSFFGTSDFGFEIAQEIGGLPWKKPQNLQRQSPFSYVEKIRTPLLIIHSEQDLRCPLEQAEQLFVALKYLGREVEYVAFEGESHGLSRGGRPQNRGERLRRIVGWFDKYL